MPSWCFNKLNVTGDEKAVQKFVKDAQCELGEDNHVLSFQNIVPVPNDILKKPYGPYGYWAQLILWGTKWDARCAEIEEVDHQWVEYTFDTAWSPPVPFLIRASKMYPDAEFRLRYDSECDDVGRIKVKDGNVVSWQELADVMEDKEKARKMWLEDSVTALRDHEETWPRFGGKDAVKKFVEQVDVSLALAL